MTVFEWLKATCGYSFEDIAFKKIALDRGVDPDADAYSPTISAKQKELMEADLIFHAILHRPSNTASLSQSHNGYSKSIGQEQDFYQGEKIKYAIGIYRRYDDDKGDILEASSKKKITFVPIKDEVCPCPIIP